MNKFKEAYSANYDKRNPKQYSDKGYRAFIIGLVLGFMAGASITTVLLVSYGLIFE